MSSSVIPVPPARRPRARGSLAWKLPLVMTAIFATGLALILAWVYTTLATRAEGIVRDRLQHAVRQVAGDAATSLDALAGTFRGVAARGEIQGALRAAQAGRLAPAQATAARGALATLALRDTTLAAELWDAHGTPIAATGTLRPSLVRPAPPADDAVAFSAVRGDGGRPIFWAVLPVRVDGVRAGFVAQPRRAGGPAAGLAMVRELTREEVGVYLRNGDGTGWSVAPGRMLDAPVRREATRAGLVYVRADSGRFVAEEAAVRGTPWVMAIASPHAWIVSRPKRTLRELSLVCLPLLALGALVTWMVGRRIARPLADLAGAAESVALGTYDRPLAGTSTDEIGRLAASFDSMARRVASTQRELERRVAEAQAAMAEAEHANRAKADFLAVMSHELRTPLNAIGGYAELIEMEIHGPVTPAQRDALQRIGRSQAHLLTLIEGVLSFARIDAGQVQYAIDDVPVHETLLGLEALVAPQLRARALTLTHTLCAPAVTARADRDKLAQVVLNLLGNAIKFTPAAGAVSLDCDVLHDVVRIHVRDTGAGIPEERLRAIFEPFVQAGRALNRPHEGVGLGLAISRDLARGMGGDVTVTSTLGVGSTFTVTLPRGRDATVAGTSDHLRPAAVDRSTSAC